MDSNNNIKEIVSAKDFIEAVLAIHRESTRTMFTGFNSCFEYKNDSDKLLAFQEIEYLAFWLFRRHMNDSIMFALYTDFSKNSDVSIDRLKEQLEIRYRIYDDIFDQFISSNETNRSAAGLRVGETLSKAIGNLEIMKNGCLFDERYEDVAKIVIASSSWFEQIKTIDRLFKAFEQKFEVDQFLRVSESD